jgi:hypothetical protein
VSAPTQQEGAYDFGKYLVWAVGGVAVGFAVGVVAGLNPLATAIAGVGGLLVANGLVVLPRWFQARGIEARSIVSLGADSGAVEVVGTTQRGEDVLTAPFSGEECLAYSINVDEYEHTGETWKWETEYAQWDSVPFVVEDGSGTAWVDPTDAEFHMDLEESVELDAGDEPPERFRQALTDGGPATGSGRGRDATAYGNGSLPVVAEGKRRRFQEFRLVGGQEVHLSAETHRVPEAAGGPDRTPSVTLADGSSTPVFSVSTDADHDVDEALLSRAAGAILAGAVLVAGGLGWALFA